MKDDFQFEADSTNEQFDQILKHYPALVRHKQRATFLQLVHAVAQEADRWH